MFENPSLVTRIGVGKAVGFVIGLCGFFILPVIAPDVSSELRWGTLFWYTTLGAIIGVFGVFTSHPVLKLPFPWWVRAPLLGAWMNFVLALVAYAPLQQLMSATFGVGSALQSPYWMVAEGAVVGLIIGYFATRFGGEGTKTVSFDANDRGAVA